MNPTRDYTRVGVITIGNNDYVPLDPKGIYHDPGHDILRGVPFKDPLQIEGVERTGTSSPHNIELLLAILLEGLLVQHEPNL